MSVAAASRVTTSRPAGVLRSMAMLRLPRLTALNAGVSLPTAPGIWRVESPARGSTLITSAPRSASSIAAYGPAITCVTASTRMPASAVRRFGGALVDDIDDDINNDDDVRDGWTARDSNV